MKREGINNMIILFFLGILFTSIATYSVYTGTIDISSKHSSHTLIIYRDVKPLYSCFFVGINFLFGIGFIKGGINEWLSRHDDKKDQQPALFSNS